jgi:hypothetical protein
MIKTMKQKIYKNIMALAMMFLTMNLVFSFAAPALGASDVNDLWGGQGQKQYVQDNSGLPSGENANDPRKVAAQVIKIILGFLGILAVIIVLYAGFKWMTAGGNEEAVGEAKKMLTAGLIGLVIILSAYAIANFVIGSIYGATTGVPFQQ